MVKKKNGCKSMKSFFLDLHIHIGCDSAGRAVKITASRQLTLSNILKECLERKGIDLIGVVDCGSFGVQEDLKRLLAAGELTELERGGLRYKDKLTLFPGVELETTEKKGGRAHFISFFPNLNKLEGFAHFAWQQVRNNQLSSQVCYLTAHELFKEVKKKEGIFIPAHVFTPHKSIYGNCASSLEELFSCDADEITAIELGLSSDREMALLIPELRNRIFLSNSDAHSLEKIGREYNKVIMEAASFEDLNKLLSGSGGRIETNYGLDPKLGKYHRSYCDKCNKSIHLEPPVLSCSYCGEKTNFVVGVLDRIICISQAQNDNGINGINEGMKKDTNYCYQIPLSFIPGVGKRTIEKLLSRFGTEMNILHKAGEEEIKEITGEKTASLIIKARQGELKITPGAGGIYGRIETGC
jgi:uncharacterized protein (TIGR00375 family)